MGKKEEIFCHLIIHLLLNDFDVAGTATGAAVQLKGPTFVLSFKSSKAVQWADFGPQALRLKPLL